jgi:hypothetical protein
VAFCVSPRTVDFFRDCWFATITIEEVVDKGKKLSIKGNDGNRTSTYSVWKLKQDGSDSLTYAQFKTMGLGRSSNVYIGYVIDEFTTNITFFK